MKILLGSFVFLILFTLALTNDIYAQDLVASSSPTLTSTPSATPQPSPTATAGTASPTPTVVPTSAPSSAAPTTTPRPAQESTSKKEVLGEKTSVLGATNSEKELSKWFLALGAGFLTVVACFKLLRSNGGQE